MPAKAPLTYLTHDEDRWLPDMNFIGRKLLHRGNGKTYVVTGYCWLGETDRWGFLHSEIREDGFPGVTIARPMSHISGDRSNGEPRYLIIER